MQKELLLLTSPPASGKTYLIGNLINELKEKPLVIVPLRALADECKAKWEDRAVVMTHEEWLSKKAFHGLVIFDEFHLFFYWGDTFRHRMWDCFFEAIERAEFVLLLTATMTQTMIEEVTHFRSHFDRLIWVDAGNQRSKNAPARYLQVPGKNWLEQNIHGLKPRDGVGLIFCQYRQEVESWEKKLKARGFSCWSCVGGEAAEFSRLVKTGVVPDFIVATTVLSHGVNLPMISRIYFTYQVQNLDFWIQMVARGGRKGERFDVFSLERPSGLSWNRFNNYLAVFSINFKMGITNFYLALQEWFLKD